MSSPIRPVFAGADKAPDARDRLKKASNDLEGVFINELFKAMRETVPEDGILSEDPGKDMFTGMMDEKLAQLQAEKSHGGIGDALYRQLSRKLPEAGKP